MVKPEHVATPRVTPPHAAGVHNPPAHVRTMTPVVGSTIMDAINNNTMVVSPKRELFDDKPPVLAEAAAAAVKASQARWRAQCAGGVEAGEPAVNDMCNGSLLPFYYPSVGPVAAAAGCHGIGVGLGGDGAGRSAFSGTVPAAQDTFDAVRMVSRRSSVEEALYGSCFKRSSFTAWVSSTTYWVVRCVALRWDRA